MGYTHYWRRETQIKLATFQQISSDFRKLLPVFDRNGCKLANGDGEGYPLVDSEQICFNGAIHCGHPHNSEVSIPWPSIKASGIGTNSQAIDGKWFAGCTLQTRCCDGDCSYETFYLPRLFKPESWEKPENGKFFNFCKTAFRPYDWAVTACLIIAKHYLKDGIEVSSDGEIPHWQDGMLLCQLELGYGMDFKLED